VFVGLAALRARPPRRRRSLQLFGGAALFGSCLLGQFVIGPRIETLRADIGPSLDALPVDDPRRAAFGRLHGVSVLALGAGVLAAVVVMIDGVSGARRALRGQDA
jgi:hypothetical protein